VTATSPAEVRYAANLTLLFAELPLLERPAAARAAGFDQVEFWWPFGTDPTPPAATVDAFVDAVGAAGVSLLAMNLFAGDMPAGERGVLSYPVRTAEFRESVAVAMDIARRLGGRLFNAPYGHRSSDLDADIQDRTATENLIFAMTAALELHGTILLEPLSGMPRYPLKTLDDAVAVLDRVRAAGGPNNLRLLLDQYHLATGGHDLATGIDAHGDLIAHVQLADVPGRGEPGSGSFDIVGTVRKLLHRGYDGAFALEYVPPDSTSASLARWRDELGRWADTTADEKG
jgi:hydroxypyruvate isomerase